MREDKGMKKKNLYLIALLVLMTFCLSITVFAAEQVESTMTLATTTSTQDSGLLDYLIPYFEQEYNTKVKVIAVGSGQAMEMGKKGDADVLLVHSRKAEDEFIAGGWGVNRKDVMHNEFLLVGPAGDPAGIKGMTDAAAAFTKIASSQSKFISRADKSGTHTKELSVWQKAAITPAGTWYVESGQGMGDTLMMANELQAYTLTDDATFLSWQNKLDLQVLVQGDPILFNPYGVIAVNPAKYPAIHFKAASAFIDFLTNSKGQGLIAEFGKDKYGKALFTADAVPAVAPSPTVAPAPAVAGTVTTYKVANIGACVRSGPGMKYDILGYVYQGDKVEVLDNSGFWYKISYRGSTAYIAGKLLTK